MSEPKRYTITAALPYANGPLHIGHLAGAYIAADIYARYLRLQGKDVVFVCGSDEHGAAITIKAKKENTTPKEIVDKYHAIIKKSFEDFGISFDIYHRTSEPIHYQTSQDIFRTLNDKNAFEIIESEQYFDEEAKQFLADRYIIGTCPKCGNENAYGDQCEKCGSSLNPTDLIHPKSTLTNSAPVLKKTKHWFLKLDAQQEGIKKWLEETAEKNNWKAHVIGQCKSWINDGLRPRAMTRDLTWGIPVPPEIEGAEDKVLYVWLDAPIGYISATKQLFKEIEENKTEFSYPTHFADAIKNGKADDWKKYWQDDETQLIHFIGKDNIVFHCITFPAILKATEQYILPDNVPANEFMNLEGDKISTSRNWAVWLHEYLEEFPGKEDELRYTLIANMPENKDSEFTWQDFQNRVNNELAANIGNFINRVAVLTHKFYDGEIPTKENEIDKNIFDEIAILKLKLDTSISNFRFKEALQFALQISSIGNKFLGDNEPWKLIKTDESRAKEIMSVAVNICNILSEILQPLLPKTALKIRLQFNDFEDRINPSEILFPKIEDEQIAFQIEKLNRSKPVVVVDSNSSTNTNNKISPNVEMTNTENKSEFINLKSEITFDDFAKLDIRTGVILEAEKVPKADKLLKLLVDIGIEKRTIVSGIAEHFKPEDIIGTNVSVLVNLAPRKLKGIESNGMILMAEDARGKLYFVQANGVASGNIIR
jgi:methionyl-tRNA synthetase